MMTEKTLAMQMMPEVHFKGGYNNHDNCLPLDHEERSIALKVAPVDDTTFDGHVNVQHSLIAHDQV